MSNPQIPGQATNLSQTAADPAGGANQLLKNPAVIALAAAFGLVLVAALIATIMGIVEQTRKTNQSTH